MVGAPDAFGAQAALMLPAAGGHDGGQGATERKGRTGRGGGGTLTGRLPAVSPQRSQVPPPPCLAARERRPIARAT